MQNINNLILDFDGILIRNTSELQDRLHIALAAYISHIKPGDFTFDTAFALAQESQKKTKKCFTPFLEKYNMTFEELAAPTYDVIDISYINPDKSLINAMKRVPAQMGILTKASMSWLQRGLRQLKLEEFFPEARIITCADRNLDKTKPETYLYAAKEFGFDIKETAMVDDTLDNLKAAKRAGLCTVKIPGLGQPHPKLDYQFHSTRDMMWAYIKQKNTFNPK